MEACAGSHFLGRALREQGHDARLMPAQYVKPYVKTNKNDYIDAEACAEAVTRPGMRFVPIKTDDQLDLQSLHRVRERWMVRRTAVINQIRGMLLQRGITIAKGRRHIEQSLPGILEDADNKLSGALRVLLGELRLEMQYLNRQIADELEDGQHLMTVPGIGPIIATARITAIGSGSAFKKGRGFAASIGVVPGEHFSLQNGGGPYIPVCRVTGSFTGLIKNPWGVPLIMTHGFVFKKRANAKRSRLGINLQGLTEWRGPCQHPARS